MFRKLTILAAMLLTAAFIMEVPKVSAYDDREFIEKCGKRLGYEYLGTTEHGKEKQEMYDELYELCCEIWESDKDIPYWKEVLVDQYSETKKCEAYPVIKVYETNYDDFLDDCNDIFFVVNMLKFDNPAFYFLNEYAVRIDDEDDTNDYKASNPLVVDHDSLSSTFFRKDMNSKYYIGVLAYEEYMNGNDRAVINDVIYDYVTKTAAELDTKEKVYDKALALHDKLISETDYSFEDIGYDPKDGSSTSAHAFNVFSHTITGVMQKNLGVCESYAETYDMVMNYAGVEDMLVESGFHSWNMVKFDDGEWYFVDSTWDDMGSQPDYLFFKKSYDEYMTILSIEREGEISEQAMHSFEIDLYSNKAVTCLFYKLPIENIGYKPEFIYPGDVNHDNKLDIEDEVMIIGYINGDNTLEYTDKADVNNDGVIDILDAVRLSGFINGSIPLN